MRNKTTYNRRNKLMYEYYCTRWGDGIRDDVIIRELHEQFHLEIKTIGNIIRMVRKQSQDAQPELPLGVQQQLPLNDRKYTDDNKEI
jgi:hypothetical protein